MKARMACLALAILALAGCAGYRWAPEVPDSMRTVAVPVFENRTDFSEFGPTATRHVLREFQNEGTFSVRRVPDAALELQGVVASVKQHGLDFDRGYDRRASEYRLSVTVELTLVDKKSGKVLFENRKVTGETTYLSQRDVLSGRRDAADRVARDIARQAVGAVLAHFEAAKLEALR